MASEVGGSKMININQSQNDISITLCALPMGNQWNITITGGTAHLGAVAVGIPRPSLSDPRKNSASVSVLTVTGHRDDDIARPSAHFLASELQQVIVVSCGIHFDNITPEHIHLIEKLVQKALKEFLNTVNP